MQKPREVRKAYAAPKLTQLGDVKELTQTLVPGPSGLVPGPNGDP